MTEEASSSTEDAPLSFHVKSSSDARYSLTVPRSMTVRELKEKLSGSEYSSFPADRQRLIYSGRVLKDADTLGTYNIREGNTIHLVKSASSNQTSTATSSSSGVARSAQDSGNPPSTVPSNLATGPGSNPLAGLTGARYAGLAQLPGRQMFGPDGGMGAPPDADGMASMLSDPQFASTLNEALANPQVVDMLIDQNPMLRDMGPLARQMMRSDEFRRMLTDPNALRQMSQMSRAMGMNPLGGGVGGVGGGLGGGSNSAFPAPGVTDTTPSDVAGGSAANPPPNPNTTTNNLAFGYGLLNPTGGMGGPGPSGSMPPNPFAALFGPTFPMPANPQPNNDGNNTTSDSSQRRQPTQQQQQSEMPPLGLMPGIPLGQNPHAMQQLLSILGGALPGGGAGGSSTSSSPSNVPLPSLLELLNERANAAAAGAAELDGLSTDPSRTTRPTTDLRPPEERYESQLRQLNDMGFFDFDRNIDALRRSGGSVNGAVEYLLTL